MLPRNGWSAAAAARKLRLLLRGELGALEFRRVLVHAGCALVPEGALGRFRAQLLRACGVRLGQGTIVAGSVRLHGPAGALARLTVGQECFFTAPLFLDLTGEIRIGDRVTIGHHVKLVTSGHSLGPPERRCAELRPRPIVIEDGCWIGAAALVLPGVTLGRGSVVAAGAVVVHDVAPDTVVAGVPARTLRSLDAAAARVTVLRPGSADAPAAPERRRP